MTVVQPAYAMMYYGDASNGDYYIYQPGVDAIRSQGTSFPVQQALRSSQLWQQTYFVPITGGTYSGKLIMMGQASTNSSNYWRVAGCPW